MDRVIKTETFTIKNLTNPSILKKKQYFKLYKDRLEIFNQDLKSSGKPKFTIIQGTDITIKESGTPPNSIMLGSKDLNIIIFTNSEEDQKDWMKALSQSLLIMRNNVGSMNNSKTKENMDSSSSFNVQVHATVHGDSSVLNFQDGLVDLQTFSGIPLKTWDFKKIRKFKYNSKEKTFSFETGTTNPNGPERLEFSIVGDYHKSKVDELKRVINREQNQLREHNQLCRQRSHSDPDVGTYFKGRTTSGTNYNTKNPPVQDTVNKFTASNFSQFNLPPPPPPPTMKPHVQEGHLLPISNISSANNRNSKIPPFFGSNQYKERLSQPTISKPIDVNEDDDDPAYDEAEYDGVNDDLASSLSHSAPFRKSDAPPCTDDNDEYYDGYSEENQNIGTFHFSDQATVTSESNSEISINKTSHFEENGAEYATIPMSKSTYRTGRHS